MFSLQFRKGFTLIELLIVVAIIAILAAIAVPNFLEAQTRAKVSRVKSDMRTIATAMEAYIVDHNTYPGDSDNTPFTNPQKGLLYLTSPIAYISTLATDPFSLDFDPNSDGAPYFEMGSGADNEGWTNRTDLGGEVLSQTSPLFFKAQSYEISSVGPDEDDDVGGNDNWPGPFNQNNAAAVRITTYDPTNGSVSNGDIVYIGGAEGIGYYFVNETLYGRDSFQ
jgi:type II secretion system protein G